MVLLRVKTGDQASLRISRQIAPEAEEMLGSAKGYR